MSMQPIGGFLSYSHKDEEQAKKLLTFLMPLTRKGEIRMWYDRMISPGARWTKEIDDKLNEADMFVYCVTANFLASTACMNELKRGIRASKERSAAILIVILKSCAWKDVKEICELQVIPKDGIAIEAWTPIDNGYLDAYEKIREEIQRLKNARSVTFRKEFLKELSDVGCISSISETANAEFGLFDVFVYPQLKSYSAKDDEEGRYIHSEKIPEKIVEHCRIQLIGAEQSGKTALCKKFCLDLLERSYYPVFLGGLDRHVGLLENRIEKAIKHQYNNRQYIDKRRLVLILDDFHKAKRQAEMIEKLEKYERVVLVVDDLFGLDVTNSSLLGKYHPYEILPLGARKRDELIRKWIEYQRKSLEPVDDNYKKLDVLTEQVNAALGNTFGKGVMTPYPFFVLSIIAVVDVAGRPLQQEVTSQGHCYQALVFLSLRRANVSEEMDSYVNFLTSLAYDTFVQRKSLGDDELAEYFAAYCKRYNFPSELRVVIGALNRAGIYKRMSNGFYEFPQKYVQYYFVAKYFAEHEQECQGEYEKLMSAIYKSSNAYVAVFMTHHSKNINYLDRLSKIATSLFKDVEACYLTDKDIKSIELHVGKVSQMSLPDRTEAPSGKRQDMLKRREIVEAQQEDEEGPRDGKMYELLSAIRVTEVLGQILKARCGSIDLVKMKKIMEEVMEVYAKLISMMLSALAGEKERAVLIDMIDTKLREKKAKQEGWTDAQVHEFAQKVYWEFLLVMLYSFVFRCVRTIGAEQLYKVICDVCKSDVLPLKALVPFGVDMFYCKQIRVKKIAEYIDKKDTSDTVKWILKSMVVHFCSTHKVDFVQRHEIESRLDMKRTFVAYAKAEGR